MESLVGKVIGGWLLKEVMKSTPRLSIYKGKDLLDFDKRSV